MPFQSDAAELVASVLLEKRNREGMVGRLMPRRERRAVPRSVISGVVEGSVPRGDKGSFSTSSARLLASAAGSIRRSITRLNILLVDASCAR